MKNVVLLVMVLMLTGCTPKSMKYMESIQVEGQHEKALLFLGKPEGVLVYKASDKAKKCIKNKMSIRGYWMLQDEIDCMDNTIK